MNQGVGTASMRAPLTYWSPSASNLVSSIVLALGADMREIASVIVVLRTISRSPREELLRFIEEPERIHYRAMCEQTFASIRAHAIAIAKAHLDAYRSQR